MATRKVANKSKSIRKPKSKGFTVYTAESSSTSDDNQLNLNPNGMSATSTGTTLPSSEKPSALQDKKIPLRCVRQNALIMELQLDMHHPVLLCEICPTELTECASVAAAKTH